MKAKILSIFFVFAVAVANICIMNSGNGELLAEAGDWTKLQNAWNNQVENLKAQNCEFVYTKIFRTCRSCGKHGYLCKPEACCTEGGPKTCTPDVCSHML